MERVELVNQHISRQLDIVPPGILDEQVNIIGAGAIGSWTALALAKMGFKNITVFDHDEVDIVNMSSQFFAVGDVGCPKVNILKSHIEWFTDSKPITAIPEKWNGMKLRGIVIMAVDSMEVRKEIFDAHKLHIPCKWIIDARMGAEQALIYTMNPNSDKDQDTYARSWYSDKEAVQERCTAKSTTYNALILSGLVAKTVKDLLVDGPYARNLTFNVKELDLLVFKGNEK